MKRSFATVISRIFDPVVVCTVLFVMIFYQSPIAIPAFLFMIVIPFILFFIAWKTKFLRDWDIRDRKERPKILWALILIEIIGSLLLQTNIFFPFIVVLIGFTLITHFWKISGHMMANAFVSGMVITKFGWDYWPVLLVVPLVGWARIETKNHTFLQVVAGAVYSWGILYFFA